MIKIPTISELYNSILADLEAEMGISIPVVGKNMLRVQAAVQAAKLRIFYLTLGKLQKNMAPDQADPESMGGTLERFGRIKLGRNPFAASAGQYTVEVTGTIGATIAASTTFKSNDDSLNPGYLFVLDVEKVLASATDTITLRSLTAGTGAKLDVSDKLTATAPIANVDKIGTITAEVVTPLDAENTEEYRKKTIEAYQVETQGGAAGDYRIWAADAAGVRRSFPFAKSNAPGEINLFIEATEADSTDGKGTPSNTTLTAVASVVELDPDTTKPINERGRRPLTVHQIHCLPVLIKEVVITITGFQGLTTTIETTIENTFEADFDSLRPFVSGADVLESKNDILDVYKITLAILKARPGSIFTGVAFTVNGVGYSSYQFTEGNIPHLNAVNFV